MTTITPFTFTDQHTVRTVLIDGTPWFVLADVCSSLGIGNSRMVATRLTDDEKGVSQVDTPGGRLPRRRWQYGESRNSDLSKVARSIVGLCMGSVRRGR